MFSGLFRRKTLISVSENGLRSVTLYPVVQMVLWAVMLWAAAYIALFSVERSHMTSDIEKYKSRVASIENQNRALGKTVEEMYGVMNATLSYLDKTTASASAKNVSINSNAPERVLDIKNILNSAEKLGDLVLPGSNADKYTAQSAESMGNYADSITNYTKRLSDDMMVRIAGLEKVISMFYKSSDTGVNRIIAEDVGAAIGGAFIPVDGAGYGQQVLEQQMARLVALRKLERNLPIGTPIPGSKISSRFGKRTDPFLHKPAAHNGVDLVAPRNSSVRTTGDGRVTHAGHMGSYGMVVIVDHGRGIKTTYAHMKKIMVDKGQKISKGDVVGIIGSTGRSTGTHLHYEVNINGKVVDPERFLYINNNDRMV